MVLIQPRPHCLHLPGKVAWLQTDNLYGVHNSSSSTALSHKLFGLAEPRVVTDQYLLIFVHSASQQHGAEHRAQGRPGRVATTQYGDKGV